MGEAKRRSVEITRLKSTSGNFFLKQQSQVGYKDDHHLREEKVVPESFIQLQRMLALPAFEKYSKRAQKGKTVEECLGIIAADLDIALDGLYDVGELCEILVEGLKHADKPGYRPELLSNRMVQAELVEEKNSITLVEIGQDIGTVIDQRSEQGPYTICNGCLTSFDCISARTCKHGKPATQLGDTMKALEVLKRSLGNA